MLRTPLSDLLHIEHPIIQAGMGPFGSGAELAATVSNAGALGTLGAAGRPLEELERQLAIVRELTDRPFAVNLVLPMVTDENVRLIFDANPPVFSLALGDPGELVERAHDAGILFIQQVHNVEQASLAAERGVDVVVAQGTEAGGFGGTVAGLALVPQVVDAVDPIPVVAAGGIADGRGLAASLTLGAVGAQLGTRFLATLEATIDDEWKQAILEASSDDSIKVDVWKEIFPAAVEGGFDVIPRALRTPFIERWQLQREEARREPERLQAEIMTAIMQGMMHKIVPFTGQSVGIIGDILPAAEAIQRLVTEAEQALRRAGAYIE